MMKRIVNGKTEVTTSWIPEEFAINGKVIELENKETGERTNGWKIVVIGTKRKEM